MERYSCFVQGLDPDYDVTRIARRYIRSLIDLRDGSTVGYITPDLSLYNPASRASLRYGPMCCARGGEASCGEKDGDVAQVPEARVGLGAFTMRVFA
eukprot:1591025-Pleurochrysis_carterae.AAC.2